MPLENIPDIVVGRLPRYLRTLTYLESQGKTVVSSQELGDDLGISAAQIRKDLSMFGEFGKQGTGYDIAFLRKQLRKILKVNRTWDVAVVGAGDIGSALARYQGFAHRGFQVRLLFDNNPSKIGHSISGITIQSIDEMETALKEAGIQIAMLAVPIQAAQEITDRLVEAGVKAILNYAPINISVPPHVHVQYIDPAIHLQHMTYYLESPED